jgi:hypothetical protein
VGELGKEILAKMSLLVFLPNTNLTLAGLPPPLKSKSPLGSLVRNMKEMDPERELFQTGNAWKRKEVLVKVFLQNQSTH